MRSLHLLDVYPDKLLLCDATIFIFIKPGKTFQGSMISYRNMEISQCIHKFLQIEITATVLVKPSEGSGGGLSRTILVKW